VGSAYASVHSPASRSITSSSVRLVTGSGKAPDAAEDIAREAGAVARSRAAPARRVMERMAIVAEGSGSNHRRRKRSYTPDVWELIRERNSRPRHEGTKNPGPETWLTDCQTFGIAYQLVTCTHARGKQPEPEILPSGKCWHLCALFEGGLRATSLAARAKPPLEWTAVTVRASCAGRRESATNTDRR